MQTKTRRPSFFAGVALSVVALSTTAIHPARAAVSEQQEIEMGQQVSAQAQKEYGRALPYNNPISRRVRMIGMQIAALSDRKNIPYSYTVLQNDKVLNAFSAPGGPVFVTTKLVSTTSNDAELAYVIGHETGHIDRRHVIKQLQKQQQLGIFGAIAGAVFGRAGQIGGSLFGTLQSLKFSRADENQADAVGVRFMSQLGYDPRAAVTMLGKLGAGGGPDFLSDHPATNARIQSVRDLIQRENLLAVAQRAGGPRLSSNLNFGSSGSDNGSDNGDNGYDSSDNSAQGGQAQGDQIDLGSPLRYVVQSGTNQRVVMAPVAGFANWAGATVSTSGNVTRLRRGSNSLVLHRGSRIAELNGASVQLPAPVSALNGELYSSLGILTRAVGASANIGSDSVQIRLNNRSGYLPLP